MAFAGALMTGGLVVGSLFSPLGAVGAQESDDNATTSTVTDDSVGHRNGPGRQGHGDPEFLQDLLGVTAEELAQAKADGQTLAEFAAAQGVDTDALVSALVDQAATRIAEAVEAGDLDEERAATMTSNLEERITERVNQAPGEGRGMRSGRPGRGLDDAVLSELGLDADALREAMSSGSTLGEAALAQGVSEEALVAALVESAETRLAEAVESGRVDADKAVEVEASIAERVQDRVDGVRPERAGRGGPRSGGHGMSAESSLES